MRQSSVTDWHSLARLRPGRVARVQVPLVQASSDRRLDPGGHGWDDVPHAADHQLFEPSDVLLHAVVGSNFDHDLIVDEAHVATVATDPEYRRQGIAKRLLAHALRQIMREGARSSFLEVRESNLAAQEMYRKFGYEVTGRRRHYYRDNDEDALLMSLEDLNPEQLIVGEGRSTPDAEEQNER